MECTFCSSRTGRSQGQKYRMRSPGNIVDEIKFFYQRDNVTVFNFMDLAFPLVKKHALEFCQLLISSGLNKSIRWVCELRVKPLDRELVSLMKKSGCARVCFGIESGNDETLKKIKKGFTRNDIIKAVELCKKEALEVDGMFMMGLPGEDFEKIDQTIQLAIDLDLRFAMFNLFVPYPGCDLYEELKVQDKLHFKDWSDFVSYPTYSGGEPVYVPQGLTKEKLMKKQAQAMKRFYFCPKFIIRQIKNFKMNHIGHYLSGLRALLSK